VIETLDIGNVSDDMTYDSAHHRIYVSSEDGVDVVAQDSPDHYHVVQHVDKNTVPSFDGSPSCGSVK
jgi:hypothetical protein